VPNSVTLRFGRRRLQVSAQAEGPCNSPRVAQLCTPDDGAIIRAQSLQSSLTACSTATMQVPRAGLGVRFGEQRNHSQPLDGLSTSHEPHGMFQVLCAWIASRHSG
jgi:hypothetical protein